MNACEATRGVVRHGSDRTKVLHRAVASGCDHFLLLGGGNE